MYDNYNVTSRDINRILRYVIITFIFFIFIRNRPWFIVEPGFAAVHTRMGRVVDIHKSSGVYFTIPFIDAIAPIDMRIQKTIIKTEAFSHDLQVIDAEIAINYRVENPLDIYINIGMNYEYTVIDPLTQESVKAIIARFSAEALTQHRDEAKDMVKKDLSNALAKVHIKLVDFNFIHADFHDDFIKSVESKQIAEQRAKQSKYETDMVKEKALQKRELADADAYALKVQKEMATPQLSLLKAIEKWDGKLPNVMTQSMMSLLNDSKS